MSPNGLAQEAMLRMAYQQAGVSPGQVQYIEAHGTGTRVGDPVEVKALTSVLSVDRADGFACALGSVKTNIGHCESAAGVAGLIKVALSLSHRVIPPHLHLKELNPLIPEASFPLKIYSKSGPWPAENEPLIAGVSSFSFGGANVHVVLGEAPATEVASDTRRETRPRVLPISARSPEALRALAEKFLATFSDSSQTTSVEDICFSAGTRRSHHEFRMAIAGEDAGDFRRALSTWLGGEDSPAVITGRRTKSSGSRVVFVFSARARNGLAWA
jgi:acyl transferase domain-containing protein